MSYAMSAVEYTVDTDATQSLYASLMVGSNGDPNGDPTYAIGDDQGEEAWGYQVWDSRSLNGAFDSGSVTFAFTGKSTGDESISVGGAAPVTYTGDSFGTIASVQLQAGVLIPAEAKLSGLIVSFYSGNTLAEQDIIPVGPDANTIPTPSTPVAEQLMTITPPSSNCDKVVIIGTLRLTAPPGSYPGTSDMFCNVFINSN
jgi:hypothetical protein